MILCSKKIQSHAIRIENSNIRSEDVTEQFIDVEARLKTKKRTRKPLH
ncbi:DUF4349 domain-containing protein [Algoriphagus boritolerans]